MVKKIYAAAFLITTIVFILGILVGLSLTDYRINQFQKQLLLSNMDFQSIELELDLISVTNRSACSYIQSRIPELLKNKIELAYKFKDVQQEKASILDKQYALALVKYWMYFKLEQEHCNIDDPSVIFFFSTDQASSKRQGEILDYIVYKTNNNLSVFAFNFKIDEPLIKIIAKIYNITSTPSIVIHNKKYEGFKNSEEITEIICNYYNMSIC
jgi:hypothetical protein